MIGSYNRAPRMKPQHWSEAHMDYLRMCADPKRWILEFAIPMWKLGLR